MKIEVRYLKDRGTNKERIVLVAKENCDIGKYFIFTSEKLEDSKISSGVTDPFWFPDKIVNEGDFIVVYSKVGVQSEKNNTDGSKSHFFYRNFSNPIFTQDKIIAILLESIDWKTIEK